MSENKSDLLELLIKKLAIRLPVVALGGVLPDTGGVFVSNASAEHHLQLAA